MLRYLSYFFIIVLAIVMTASQTVQVMAEDPTATPTVTPSSSDNVAKGEIERKIKEYEAKLADVRSQKNTLSAQIQYMDTQMYLTELKITETEKNIETTEKEIKTLGSKINGLDSSLDRLSESMLERIKTDYKNRKASLIDIVLDSTNVSRLVNRVKYYDLARESNQKILLQVQEAKLNFEKQKDLREKKVEELDKLTEQLAQQKISLDSQKVQKQKLLADTQNDENTYQKLLQQAKQQLDSFKSFVQTSGASSIVGANSFGSGSDGNYYSQRDERWASQALGYSNENVLSVGCLLSSIAMVGKKNGSSATPGDLARETNRFWGNTAWMNYPWPGVAGKSYTRVTDIDGELAAGNYVIVGVKINNCSAGGNHFVVLTKKDGEDYIMHDPIYGPDIKFSSHYSTMCSSATFK